MNRKGVNEMNLLVVSKDEYEYVDVVANFETPNHFRNTLNGFFAGYRDSFGDDDMATYMKKRCEIYLKKDIDIFVLVKYGRIYVLERKI